MYDTLSQKRCIGSNLTRKMSNQALSSVRTNCRRKNLRPTNSNNLNHKQRQHSRPALPNDSRCQPLSWARYSDNSHFSSQKRKRRQILLRSATIESFSEDSANFESFTTLDDAQTEVSNNPAEKLLTAVLKATGLLQVIEWLQNSIAIKVLSWCLLLSAGVATLMGTVGQTYINAAVAGVYVLLGTPEVVHVLYHLVKGNVDIHTLTTCAVFGTVFLGCAIEGGLLLALFATAGVIENRLTSSAQGDLKALWDSIPSEANTVDMQADGGPDMESVRVVPARSVVVGSFTLVRAGEVVPLDGTIKYGRALVTTQHITGEALPLPKKCNEEVPAGAQVVEGVLVVETTCDFLNSTPSRIAQLTAAAQKRRPNLQNMLSQWGDLYSRAVLLATFLLAAGLTALGVPFAGPGGAAYRAFGFLSAAAPCAMLMAPLAYVAAIGACAQKGVLVRGGITFDKLRNVDTIALDKTGTLTTGIMHCESIEGLHKDTKTILNGNPLSDSDHQTLAIATALERLVVHPVARAVVQCGERFQVPALKVDNFQTYHGSGVEATLLLDPHHPKLVRFGNVGFVSELVGASTRELLEGKNAGHKGVVVSALAVMDAKDTSKVEDVKIFTFSDTLRERSLSAVQELSRSPWKKNGKATEVMILTGDNEKSAQRIADELKFQSSQVLSGMLPEDKMTTVQKLKGTSQEANNNGNSEQSRVMMVGDGINDAPALAEADVGVAIVGAPSEAAASVADVLLLHKDSSGISQLPFVMELAHRTRSVLMQNIVLAGASIVCTSVGAVCGVIPLWLTVILHEGTTLLVGLNSVRLLVPNQSKKYVVGATLALAAISAVAFPQHLERAWMMVRAQVTTWWSMLTKLELSTQGVVKGMVAGACAGVLHTLTGPDHLAALAPLTIGRSRAQSTILGGLWGMGHNTGQLAFGLIFLFLRDRFHFNMDVISQWGSGIVGVTLVLIGLLGLKEASEIGEDDCLESSHETEDERLNKERTFSISTFFTGLVHGLQPDALLVLLPALAMSLVPGAAYLVTFLIGTVVAMASYTFFLGVSSAAVSKISGGNDTIKNVSRAAAFVAIFVGVSLILSATLGIELLPGGH